jgi:predicted HicB family RNase H-like nuclease
MTELFIAIAQAAAPPDIISGGAGWVGTGLLSSVLAWIFFAHIPAKDKQIAALIESHAAQIRELTVAHQEAIKTLVADFRASVTDMDKRCAEMDRERRHDYNGQLQRVVSHCEAELSLTNQAIRRDLDELNGLMADLRMQVWSRSPRTDKPGHQPPPAPPGPAR